MNITLIPAAVIASAMLIATAAHAQVPIQIEDGMLTNESGMTLYTYDKDEAGSGQSNCYEKCAQNWPPAQAQSDATAEGDYTLIERKDGSQQWAYKGQPLYTFVKDQNPGDQTGDGVGGMWNVARE